MEGGDVETAKHSSEIPIQSSIFSYNSPLVQVTLIGLVCFCCPGMLTALSGIGGGQLNRTAANNANTALYITFAVFSFLGGGVYNIIGPKLTLFSGCSTYVLCAGSFIYYNHYQNPAFAIIAGVFLGIGSGFLWASQGAIMTSYPPRNRKGSYIALFWTIFNMGGVSGSLILIMFSFLRNNNVSVNDVTYIGFLIFMLIGTLLALSILHPSQVVRNDGSRCSSIESSSVGVESREILKLFRDWRMLLLLPASWASTFFSSYQFISTANGKRNRDWGRSKFDMRIQWFNNSFYLVTQMIGAVVIGLVMDFGFKSRRARGLVGVGVVAVVGTAICGLALAVEFAVASPMYSSGDGISLKVDANEDSAVLYLFYGLLAGMFQSLVYWVIGALADDSEILSRYSGFYKGVQSVGAFVALQLDAHDVSFLNGLLPVAVLMTISYVLLVVLIRRAVIDDVEVEGNSEEGGTTTNPE